MNFRKLAFVDESVYERSSNRDKSLINTYALFVPISAAIAGYAIYYGVYFVLQLKMMAIATGLLATYALFQHDKTLLDTFNTSKIVGRVVFSVIVALVMAIPYKVDIARDSLIQQIEEQVATYNAGVNEEMLAQEQYIYDQEQALNAKISAAGEAFDRTRRGQQLIELRREKKSFLEKKELMIASIRENYNAQLREADLSNTALAGVYLKEMFNTENPSTLFVNLFIFVILLFIEAMPAFSRLLLSNGDYMRIKEHLEKIAIEADNSMWDIDNQLINENRLSEMPQLLMKREAFKLLKKEAKQDFTDAEGLIKLFQKAGMIPDKEKKQQKRQNFSENGQKKRTDEDEFHSFNY